MAGLSAYRAPRDREYVLTCLGEVLRVLEGAFVDIVATSTKDGSTRSVRRFRALEYNIPRGSGAGYMPELNVLIGPNDFSAQSDQPLMKSLQVRITPAE